MVVTINILGIFGLAEPLAKLLNAQKENKILWKVVQGASFFLALILVIPLLLAVGSLYGEGFSTANPAVLVFPVLFIVELSVLEAAEVAGWYQEGRELITYRDGSWVMLKVS